MEKKRNKSESKYFNTAVKMDEAFLKLLSEKEFEYITIKDICALAGVNRSTFYLHYETVGDLLTETMEYIGEKFSSYFQNANVDIKKLSTLPLHELYLITPEYLIPWLTFTKENKRLFQTVLKRMETLKVAEAYEEIFKQIISPILTRFGALEEDKEYISLFFVEGILAIVKQWLRTDCARSVEEIAKLITHCVQSYEN